MKGNNYADITIGLANRANRRLTVINAVLAVALMLLCAARKCIKKSR